MSPPTNDINNENTRNEDEAIDDETKQQTLINSSKAEADTNPNVESSIETPNDHDQEEEMQQQRASSSSNTVVIKLEARDAPFPNDANNNALTAANDKTPINLVEEEPSLLAPPNGASDPACPPQPVNINEGQVQDNNNKPTVMEDAITPSAPSLGMLPSGINPNLDLPTQTTEPTGGLKILTDAKTEAAQQLSDLAQQAHNEVASNTNTTAPATSTNTNANNAYSIIGDNLTNNNDPITLVDPSLRPNNDQQNTEHFNSTKPPSFLPTNATLTPNNNNNNQSQFAAMPQMVNRMHSSSMGTNNNNPSHLAPAAPHPTSFGGVGTQADTIPLMFPQHQQTQPRQHNQHHVSSLSPTPIAQNQHGAMPSHPFMAPSPQVDAAPAPQIIGHSSSTNAVASTLLPSTVAAGTTPSAFRHRHIPNQNNNNTNAVINNQTQHQVPYVEKRRRVGAKKGATRTEFPQAKWFQLCQLYIKNQPKYSSQVSFLRSPDSGSDISDRHQMCFSRALQRYHRGELKNDNTVKRVRKRKFSPVEEKLVEYLRLRESLERMGQRLDPKDLTWTSLQAKAQQWATSLGLEGFTASPGWVSSTLKRARRQLQPSNTAVSQSTNNNNNTNVNFALANSAPGANVTILPRTAQPDQQQPGGSLVSNLTDTFDPSSASLHGHCAPPNNNGGDVSFSTTAGNNSNNAGVVVGAPSAPTNPPVLHQQQQQQHYGQATLGSTNNQLPQPIPDEANNGGKQQQGAIENITVPLQSVAQAQQALFHVKEFCKGLGLPPVIYSLCDSLSYQMETSSVSLTPSTSGTNSIAPSPSTTQNASKSKYE